MDGADFFLSLFASTQGLESGLIYTCSLRVKDAEGRVRVASDPVWVEPGYPKLLKDTSGGTREEKKCARGVSFGLAEGPGGRGIFVKDGCQGVFLLPGDLGLLCRSTDASYVECYPPGASGGASEGGSAAASVDR